MRKSITPIFFFILYAAILAAVCSSCNSKATSMPPPQSTAHNSQSITSTPINTPTPAPATNEPRDSQVSGKYTLLKVIEDGEEISAEEFDEDEFSLTFNSNGNGTIISEGSFQGDFSWSQTENTITIYLDGEVFAAKKEGNIITLDDDGTIMVFSK